MKKDQEFYEGFYENRIKTSWLGDMAKVTERLRQHYIARAVAKFRPRHSKLRLLDVGCGRGQLTPYLNRYGDVLGLDYSQTAVDYCRRKYPTATFETVDVLEQGFGNCGRFHVIVSTEVVEHLPKHQQAPFVGTLWSMLEPGGVLVLTTPDRATADFLKTDPTLDDAEYYRQYEGQPIANLLNRAEFIELAPSASTILDYKSYSPVVRPRFIDLALKAASATFKYVPLQWVGDAFRLPCKSQMLVLR